VIIGMLSAIDRNHWPRSIGMAGRIRRNPQRGCARPCPRTGQHGGVPTVSTRAQEGRNAVRSHEAYLQARSPSTARPERRQGRGAAHRNGAKPAAAYQATMSSPTSARCLPSVASRRRRHLRCCSPSMKGAKSMVERAPKRNRQKIAEFCNAIGGGFNRSMQHSS
jgi:hypothetical protein